MKAKIKYLSLFLLLPFAAGQVQYASSSYFCTMTAGNAPVTCSSSALDDLTDCDQCCSAIVVINTGPTLHSDCMKVRFEQKSIVDDFTGSQKVIHNFHKVAVVSYPFPIMIDQVFNPGYKLFTSSVSPPLDLPTVNSNLRI